MNNLSFYLDPQASLLPTTAPSSLQWEVNAPGESMQPINSGYLCKGPNAFLGSTFLLGQTAISDKSN